MLGINKLEGIRVGEEGTVVTGIEELDKSVGAEEHRSFEEWEELDEPVGVEEWEETAVDFSEGEA